MREVQAGGALIWRKRGRTLEVLLVHRPSYDDWSWPKGKPGRWETLPACAVREVEEETGLRVRLGVPLPSVSYTLADGSPKTNWYWAACEISGGPASRARRAVESAPEREVDETVWVDAVTALTMLTRRSDREPLKALLDLHADDHLETWAVLITRHGRARARADWRGGERTRPLTGEGRRQSKRLVQLFSAFGAASIVSSAWRRCLDTVAPYAHVAHLEIDSRSVLTEKGARQSDAKVRRLVRRAIRSSRTTIVCTHRPVLPEIFAAVNGRTGKRVRGTLPAGQPLLQPGEVLVAHVAARPGKRPRVIALETHAVPGGKKTSALTSSPNP